MAVTDVPSGRPRPTHARVGRLRQITFGQDLITGLQRLSARLSRSVRSGPRPRASSDQRLAATPAERSVVR